jgi:hypothetical protein
VTLNHAQKVYEIRFDEIHFLTFHFGRLRFVIISVNYGHKCRIAIGICISNSFNYLKKYWN